MFGGLSEDRHTRDQRSSETIPEPHELLHVTDIELQNLSAAEVSEQTKPAIVRNRAPLCKEREVGSSAVRSQPIGLLHHA